jgi:hypothetical protein
VELKEGVEFKRKQRILKTLRKLSKNNLTSFAKKTKIQRLKLSENGEEARD